MGHREGHHRSEFLRVGIRARNFDRDRKSVGLPRVNPEKLLIPDLLSKNHENHI